MASPTMNDWRTFETVKNKDKAAVLYAYLCQGYNMVEVAQVALHDYNDMASQRVSNITRCYGFSGQNGGRYRKYDLSLADIEGFVKKHPDGCHDYRIMDEYVKKLAESRQRQKVNSASKQASNVINQQTSYYQNQRVDIQKETNYVSEEKEDRPPTREEQQRARRNLAIGGVGILVCKFVLSWNWIVSIIVGLVLCAVLQTLSENT